MFVCTVRYLGKQEKELAKEIKKILGDIDYEKYLMYLESTMLINFSSWFLKIY